MHLHLIGVCGTGMGAFAGILKEAGHRVTGSDRAFNPPMGPALESWGIETMTGFKAENIHDEIDLVVVGNVCRSDNPEARAAIDGGLDYTSMPQALAKMVLNSRRSLVVAGTHGKTTTTSLVAHLLDATGHGSGFLVGGIPLNFGKSFALGREDQPFVIEGDEYDSAFFEKTPKFFHYNAQAALLTSIEYDHMDIYANEDDYFDAYRRFVQQLPADGLLVAFAGDPLVREVAKLAKCNVRFYALQGDDCGDVSPIWLGARGVPDAGITPLDLYGGGSFCGRVMSPMIGAHNARNLVGALALVCEGAHRPLDRALAAIPSFAGVRRRQELVGEVSSIRVYDDFAHHPSAVEATIRAFAEANPASRIVVAFEPASATASRKIHQNRYINSFSLADRVHLAPVARKEIPQADRLDTNEIAASLRKKGSNANAHGSIDALIATIVSDAKPDDVIVLMSNSHFSEAHDRILAALIPQNQ